METSPTEIISKLVGNPLGASRAEADTTMLEHAFVKTHDYQSLISTEDFNFVVGRRGTGKTALFLKIEEHYRGRSGVLLSTYSPEEHASISLCRTIEKFTDTYSAARVPLRIVWRLSILQEAAIQLSEYWKIQKADKDGYILDYVQRHATLLRLGATSRCTSILSNCIAEVDDPENLPARIVEKYDVSNLESKVREILESANRRSVVLFDGLDEGWRPTPVATAILGGLALAAADLRDRTVGISCLLFFRDNLFRDLATRDPDFSRHIEGSTLRLHWDVAGLLNVVASRLRHSLDMEKTENDVKVWNRFAHHDIQGRDGFSRCLHNTLYRPRDILVLLNQAFHRAARSGRQEIVGEDIESVSTQISDARLQDLIKEYETVFPGLRIIVDSFQGSTPSNRFDEILSRLGGLIDEVDYADPATGDLAILGSGEQMFNALYSIGFLGFRDSATGHITFRHDGGATDTLNVDRSQEIVVHPCYWKALGLSEESIPIHVATEIHDDEADAGTVSDLSDMRTRQLGQLVSELPSMPLGKEGAADFEKWAYTAVRILFSGSLRNPELKPNGEAIQRRDIVATNHAQNGFWGRVLHDYDSRLIVFEVKNYQDLKLEDYRQVLSYTSNEYGRFAVIVSRSESKGVGDTERGWLQTMYHEHKRIILTIPASEMVLYLRKARNPRRIDYCEDQLHKRLDTFLRSYLSLKHVRKTERRRKRRK